MVQYSLLFMVAIGLMAISTLAVAEVDRLNYFEGDLDISNELIQAYYGYGSSLVNIQFLDRFISYYSDLL